MYENVRIVRNQKDKKILGASFDQIFLRSVEKREQIFNLKFILECFNWWKNSSPPEKKLDVILLRDIFRILKQPSNWNGLKIQQNFAKLIKMFTYSKMVPRMTIL